MFKRFQNTFERSLADFWIDNVHGLDVEKFDAEVVKSGGHSLLEAVETQWGRDGVTVIKRLLPKRPATRKRSA